MKLLENIEKFWKILGEPDVDNYALSGDLAVENFEALKILEEPNKHKKERFTINEKKAIEMAEDRYNNKGNKDKNRDDI